jgi:hypothetical protein
MSFSGIISLNHNNPILMLMKYSPYNFYVTSRYMVLSTMNYHKIKKNTEILHILYSGEIPLNIFDNFDNFYLLNKQLSGYKYSIVLIKCIDDVPKEVYLSTDETASETLNFHVSKNTILFSTFNGYETMPEGCYMKINLNENLEVEKQLFSQYIDEI